MNEEVRHFSLRKLSVGLASVLVGVSIFGASQTVKADTVTNNQTSNVINNAQSADTQENKNSVKSSFSNDNQADNAKSKTTQTQENEPKQVQAENVQQDSVPKTQETTDNKDLGAEKGIVRTSSLQEPDNQSNTVTGKTVQHDTFESGQKEQSFNLPKNSQKLNRKVLATNLIATPSVTNGGFDEATWGKLDVNDWQGSVKDGVYQLTHYSGDLSHIIVPNEADFEKAGKSTNGLQVGITRDTIKSLSSYHSSNRDQRTIAFSKTNDQKVKAIGTDWSNAFSRSVITNFDGSNLDVSGVTNMNGMFSNNQISDLTSLTNWDTSSVTNMSYMFFDNSISDLRPLINWKTSNVTDMHDMFGGFAHYFMGGMFGGNRISDLAPLTKWDVSNVTDMSEMFEFNKISDLTPLVNWDTSKVTNMNFMFGGNQISDLRPLANWNIGKVVNMGRMFVNNQISDLTSLANWNTSKVTDMGGMFDSNQISDLTPLANWDTSNVTDMNYIFARNPNLKDIKAIANWNMSSIDDWYSEGLFNGDRQLDLTDIDMQAFLKKHGMSQVLQGSAFLTNDVDFVKANLGKTLSTLTNTATRTIVFNFPDGTSNTITQTIYYKTKTPAPAQIYWPAVSHDILAMMALNSPLLAKNTPVQADPDGFTPVALDDPNSGNPYNLQLIKIYTAKDIKASDWQLDDTHSKDNLANSITVNGQVYFKPVPIPHFKGYKARIVKNPINHMKLMVSFMAVPTENKPSTPVEVTPSKPSATIDNPSKPSAPVDDISKPADDLQKHTATKLNSIDSVWTMPADASDSTYTVNAPTDATIDLSDLVIAEPVHAQTRMQIHVTKRFKLSKKHIAIKHLKHRKKAVRQFKKYRL